MTHPLTPREKVELKPCPFCGGSPEMEFSEFELHDGFHVVCVGDKNCPLYCSEPYRAHDTQKEAAEVWNRRTALASGSGDHAELARAMERAKENAMALALTERAEFAEAELQRSTANMCEQFNRAEALLAENAALRTAVEIRDGHINRLIDRATEAERKLAEAVADKDAAFERLDAEINQHSDITERLAEAVGLLEPFAKLADEEGGYREDDRLAWGLNTADINWGDLRAARDFLSKEAERG